MCPLDAGGGGAESAVAIAIAKKNKNKNKNATATTATTAPKQIERTRDLCKAGLASARQVNILIVFSAFRARARAHSRTHSDGHADTRTQAPAQAAGRLMVCAGPRAARLMILPIIHLAHTC